MIESRIAKPNRLALRIWNDRDVGLRIQPHPKTHPAQTRAQLRMGLHMDHNTLVLEAHLRLLCIRKTCRSRASAKVVASILTIEELRIQSPLKRHRGHFDLDRVSRMRQRKTDQHHGQESLATECPHASSIAERYCGSVCAIILADAAPVPVLGLGASGPRPSLIKARESGVTLLCHPLSDCSFCIAEIVFASHVPVGSPVR